jgi:hypothetical protein
MSDIVERLRALNHSDTLGPYPLTMEAADEIERLRAALVEIQYCEPVKAAAIASRALDEGLPTAEDVRGILREPRALEGK